MEKLDRYIYYSLLKDYINKNGVMSLRVSGGSMRPFINSGDKIQLENVNPDEIKTGDVILYEIDNQFLVHRVIKILDNGSFVVAGDSRRDVPAYEIEWKNILGKVINHKSELVKWLEKKTRGIIDIIYQIFGVLKDIFLRKIAQNE